MMRKIINPTKASVVTALIYLASIVGSGYGLSEDCSCQGNFPIKASYDYTSEVLNLALNESLSANYPVLISYCNNGTVEKYLNQTCSAIDINLSPETFSDLIAIGIPPTCHSCYPDYVVYTAIQFSNNGTVPSSSLQQYQFSGNCLMPITVINFPGQCSDPIFIFSANGITVALSLGDQTNFFHLELTMGGTIAVCFKNTEPYFQKFGDVKEVLVQEVCLVPTFSLCTNISLIESVNALNIYGTKGLLTLDLNGTDLQPDTVCSLKNNTTSLPVSSPQPLSSSQLLPNPTLSSSVAQNTESFPSSSLNPIPKTSPTPSPTTGAQPLLGVILGSILGVVLLILVVTVVIVLIIICLRNSSYVVFKRLEMITSELPDKAHRDEEVQL